jgi:plasmid stabilization system protein ParE
VTLPVVWIPEAAADLEEARAWYADIRPELGERFALAVEATVNSIAENPLQFPVVYRNRRRAGVRRFPYGVFFEVQEQRMGSWPAFTAGAIRNAGNRGRGAHPSESWARVGNALKCQSWMQPSRAGAPAPHVDL